MWLEACPYNDLVMTCLFTINLSQRLGVYKNSSILHVQRIAYLLILFILTSVSCKKVNCYDGFNSQDFITVYDYDIL